MKRRTCLTLGAAWLARPALASDALADDALWALLAAGGQVVLVRHAMTTPGVGDPPGMRLDDCSTQRNLTEEGRGEARRLGQAWRARKLPLGEVLSSPWCRCLETARLAFGKEPKVHPALSNLFGRAQGEPQQVSQLKALVSSRPERGNTVMLTHGSTAAAISGVSPGTTEMVILTPLPNGEFRLAGRLHAS